MPDPIATLALPDQPVDAPYEPIAAEKILRGAPGQRSLNLFESGDGRLFAGIWESTTGAWRVSYDEEEYCRILQGRARLIPDAGPAAEYGVGDSFLIPRGFRGVWETVEDVRKIYVIYA